MLRSMYSGISGMKNSQTKLDVIGNNIANVNTYGFKKGRVTFKDAMNQQLTVASAPTGDRGGTNPSQVGLGSAIGTVDTIHDGASLQTTNRALDLGIEGDGYFILTDGDREYYTRAGNFYLDEDGTLVNADGLKVQAQGGGDIEIDVEAIASFSIDKFGNINGVESDGSITLLATIGLVKFSNPSGLLKSSNNIFEESVNSGEPIEGVLGDNLGTILSGALEMSNVDLAEEFTEMIVAQRAFQANTKIITTSDEILQELVNLKR